MGEEAAAAAATCSHYCLPGEAAAVAATDAIHDDDPSAPTGSATAEERPKSALEQEVAELRRLRMEDARANEKVVGMFAAQEQAWMVEKRKLKLQIQALFDQFRRIEAAKEETIVGLARQVEEKGRAAVAAEGAVREEKGRNEELERRLREAEEVRGLLEAEAKEREAEIQGNKEATAELAAEKQQLEEQADRLAAELENARRELEEARARADESASEVAALREAAEHKDRVLSAMLRKAKLDAAERQALTKEARACRARARQAEMEAEAERWRWGNSKKGPVHSAAPRIEVEGSSRGLERRRGGGEGRRAGKTGAAVHPRTLLLEYLEAETLRERECGSPEDDDDGCLVATAIGTGGGGRWLERCRGRGSEELVTADARQLQEWVRSEVEKRASAAEKRHRSELEAFTEQMRLKDERLDSLRWQLLTAELELKRVQSHADGVDGSLSRAREENVRLEALLADRERELKAVRDRFTLHVMQGGCCRRSHQGEARAAVAPPKVMRGAWREKSSERKGGGVVSVRDLLGLELDNEDAFGDEQAREVALYPPEAGVPSKHPGTRQREEQEEDSGDDGCEKKLATNTTRKCSSVVTPLLFKSREMTDPVAAAQALLSQVIQPQDACDDDAIEEVDAEEEEEEEKEVVMDPSCGRRQDNSINNHHNLCHLQGEEEDNPTSCEISPVFEKQAQKQQPRGGGGDYCTTNYRWKAEDLHAMGVSYKIKRLRQQLVVLEKLASNGGSKDSSGKKTLKGFSLLVSLLSKQVKRYQSLEEKTDDLCNRMGDNERAGVKAHGAGRRRSTSTSGREQLERFLEETFQLQRYVVATGQKLTEIQSRIALSSLVGSGGGTGEEMGERAGFRMGQFADIVRGLLRDVQRGFEVRISRVIGGIEGTLASEGIRHI